MPTVIPLILASGQGTRLWPKSRSAPPKHFIDLVVDTSLFEQGLGGSEDAGSYGAPIVITNAKYCFPVSELTQECGTALATILLELMARNTTTAQRAKSQDENVFINVLAQQNLIPASAECFGTVDSVAIATRDGI